MNEDLQRTIEKLRSRIKRLFAKTPRPNEQETKSSLVTPMLRALGWDCEEAEAVRLEYRYRPQDNPVDYALMVGEQPRVFVEAKPLGKDLREHKWRAQTVNYANSAGVNWCVLTDGNAWLVYKSNAEGDLEQKLFLETCLHPLDGKVPANQPLDVLSLLSQESVAANRLNSRWQALDIDRRGIQALCELLDRKDPVLVRRVEEHSGLARGEVLSVLSRVRLTLEPGAIDAALPKARERGRVVLPEERRGEAVLFRLSGRMGAERKGVTAQCRMIADGKTQRYVVLKGSLAVVRVQDHFLKKRGLVEARQDLIARGVLKQVSDDHYEFTRDEEFSSSSKAAGIILGSSSQGPLCWEDENGRLLDEFRPIPKRERKRKKS